MCKQNWLVLVILRTWDKEKVEVLESIYKRNGVKAED